MLFHIYLLLLTLLMTDDAHCRMAYEYHQVLFYKIILTTSAVSSTNLGSILIFASCVVGTCSIYYVGEIVHVIGGVLLFCFSPL